ncbi:twinfilin 1 [Trichuris trichiura]|uniref:Twinfilin n=1 Tax=Trichuris trichiura TaxID=36087 RepID=A0A077YVU9_TRITR|nr:twinfilin 1 [Trichuris trichiura]
MRLFKRITNGLEALFLASAELIHTFNECKNGSVRLLKIVIKHALFPNTEQLIGEITYPSRLTWSEDAKQYLNSSLVADKPCYVLFRLDTTCTVGFEWLLFSFVPDTAPVRERMLYASTKATLRQEFGPGCIRHDFHITKPEDMQLATMEKLLQEKSSQTIVPSANMDNLHDPEINHHQSSVAYAAYDKAVSRGIRFPIDRDALDALGRLRDDCINYVQLVCFALECLFFQFRNETPYLQSVDILNEAVKLEEASQIPCDQVKMHIPTNCPRYHFYALRRDGANASPIVLVIFFYTLPSEGSSIKERMLYSTCKGPFLETVEDVVGIRIQRKVEVDSKETIDEKFFVDLLDPSSPKDSAKFLKPKGPIRQRGERRLNNLTPT